MDEWEITYFDAAGNEHLDCLFAESAGVAIIKFHELDPIEWTRIVKVELKR